MGCSYIPNPKFTGGHSCHHRNRGSGGEGVWHDISAGEGREVGKFQWKKKKGRRRTKAIFIYILGCRLVLLIINHKYAANICVGSRGQVKDDITVMSAITITITITTWKPEMKMEMEVQCRRWLCRNAHMQFVWVILGSTCLAGVAHCMLECRNKYNRSMRRDVSSYCIDLILFYSIVSVSPCVLITSSNLKPQTLKLDARTSTKNFEPGFPLPTRYPTICSLDISGTAGN